MASGRLLLHLLFCVLLCIDVHEYMTLSHALGTTFYPVDAILELIDARLEWNTQAHVRQWAAAFNAWYCKVTSCHTGYNWFTAQVRLFGWLAYALVVTYY
jgi:hypothetical protein